MPGREDPSEAPVFVERQTGVAEVSNQYSEPRDMTPTGVAAREPFEVHDPYDPDNAAEAKNEEVEVSIEDVVNNIIIHDDKPIENLPRMEAPELKLIGRCVSLCVLRKVNEVEQLFYYTGLVSSVTFTAVTLMHVNRYTREDFKIYVAREKQVTKDGLRAEKQVTGSATGRVSGLPSHGYTAEGEVGVERDGGLAGTQDAAALLRLDAAGSLAPAIDLPTADDAATAEVPTSPLQPDAAAPPQTSTRALRHRQFRECDTSLGPIPYMTFLRKNIHDVRFGRDPRSSFYSLFQDPSREITDMQYLRMFVRRYLVHTSEGNNPRQVPLYAFVTVRCACPDMDRELVNRVAREELPGLMRSDKSIEKEKKRQRTREIRREQAIQAFQAPDGLFSHTGILYVTRLPQITFLTAMVIFFFVLVFVLYLGISMGVMNDPLIITYERTLLGFFVPSIIVWAIAGILTVLHCLYVRVPLRTSFLTMILRSIWSLGGFACGVMVLVVAAERLKNEKLFNFMNSASENDLCRFYEHYSCSGFFTTCGGTPSLPMCSLTSCLTSPAGLSTYATPCYVYLWNRVQLQLIPLLIFAAIILLLFAFSIYMLWKLWYTADKISARLQ